MCQHSISTSSCFAFILYCDQITLLLQLFENEILFENILGLVLGKICCLILQELHGRRLRVNYATEKRPGGFGGGYGSGGGYNYGGGGAGGYASGNYGGGGNYGTNNSYPAGGGNYGGGMGYGSGGEQGSFGGGYAGGDSGNYNAGVSGSNDLFNNSEFGGSSGSLHYGSEEQLSADQGTESINNDFTPGAEGSYTDDNDEPNDYANSRS